MTTNEYPRDDLFRMVTMDVAHVELRTDGDSDSGGPGTLVGYAAMFNQRTVIDSWEGKFEEQIAPGAFRKTLDERGSRIKVLFNHGFDPSIGEKPLGRAAVQEEDDIGLRVEVPLDDTSYNRDLAQSIRSGALDGMSFRFSVIRDHWDDSGDMDVRTLQEVRLYEYGPVTFPAYEATTVGVRTRLQYETWRNATHNHHSDAADSGTSLHDNDTPPNGHLSLEAKTRRIAARVALINEVLRCTESVK